MIECSVDSVVDLLTFERFNFDSACGAGASCCPRTDGARKNRRTTTDVNGARRSLRARLILCRYIAKEIKSKLLFIGIPRETYAIRAICTYRVDCETNEHDPFV